MKIKILAAAVLIQLFGSGVSCSLFASASVQESDLVSGISPAAEPGSDDEVLNLFMSRALALKAEFDRIGGLARLGSVSQHKLRQARLDYQVAELEFQGLQNPAKKREVALAIVELEHQAAEKEFEVVSNLFKKGAASKLDFERAESEFDISRLTYENAKKSGSETLLDFRIANRKLELAKTVFEKATRLFQSKSISPVTFEKARQRLVLAEEGVALARRSIGVVVKQVPPGKSKE